MNLLDWLLIIAVMVLTLCGLWIAVLGLIFYLSGRMNSLRDEYDLEKYDP